VSVFVLSDKVTHDRFVIDPRCDAEKWVNFFVSHGMMSTQDFPGEKMTRILPNSVDINSVGYDRYNDGFEKKKQISGYCSDQKKEE
jgi:hypothetical protein